MIRKSAEGARLSVEDLRSAVESGEIDTVLLGFTDSQGRLQGKRCAAAYFLNEVLDHGAGACDYLLSVNVEMEPQSGFERTGWDRGFGDFVLTPDLSTLRLAGWRDRAAVCLADALAQDGSPIEESPRQILRRQLKRLAERGWTAQAATELEFIVHRESYREAWDKGYQNLTPANRYNVDYSLLGQAETEPLIDEICRTVQASGLVLETAKGEANLGQHEINFKYADAMTAGDDHVLFKQIVKEVSLRLGMSTTFMAKWNHREGNSCHVHLSLTDAEGRSVFAEHPVIFDQFIAGQLDAMGDLALSFAPNVNSYKRFASGSFAPTSIAWGRDNRTCAVRVVGSGPSLRLEHRLGGADVNPYLVLAAVVAAGLHGIDNELELPPAETGNGYTAGAQSVPLTLGDAVARFSSSALPRKAFGDRVVNHYTRLAEIERDEFATAVTDWERVRGYERL